MGKKPGPKRGTGGRPILYTDPYHVILRALAAEQRRRKRQEASA